MERPLKHQPTENIRVTLGCFEELLDYARKGWVSVTQSATPGEPTEMNYSETCPAELQGRVSLMVCYSLPSLEVYVHAGGPKPRTILEYTSWIQKMARLMRDELSERARC